MAAEGHFYRFTDVDDEAGWVEAMRLWIETPQAYSGYESAITAHFCVPDWQRARARMFELARQAV